MKVLRYAAPVVLLLLVLGCSKGGDTAANAAGTTGSSTSTTPPPAPDPKETAMKLMDILHTEDWKGLHALVAVSEKNKADMGTADKFAEDVKKGMDADPNSKVVHELFASMTNIKAGEPTVTGDSATVPTSCTITVQGKTVDFKGTANLVKDDGIWKWKLNGSDDVEKETATQVQEILGKPDQPKASG